MIGELLHRPWPWYVTGPLVGLVMVPSCLAALAGTWIYGWLRPRLPH